MTVLITGASGYIGSRLAHNLANSGIKVHAFTRSEAGRKWLLHPNITSFTGDILQMESIATAMKGCQQVYHAAAKVGAWAKDPSEFDKVNVDGTVNVLKAAVSSGVERVVFTSTSGVFGPTLTDPLNENTKRSIDFSIDYDRTKKLAEDIVLEYAQKGLHATIVNPSKVYGPGHTSHSLTATAIIRAFLKSRIAFIPSPGTFKVSLAYVDDVVKGHILAMEKGVSGEKYILGGHNISYHTFFDRIRTLSNCKGYIFKVPKHAIKFVAHLQQLTNKMAGVQVRFPVNAVDHAFSHYTFSSAKAIEQLGYTITPLDEAITKTIQFLQHEQN